MTTPAGVRNSLLRGVRPGGSNSSRVRLWKLELQQFADELGFPITVRQLPLGTRKWNDIEHQLFSVIGQNWRGNTLITHEVIVNLIVATTTKKGLTVRCALDQNEYPAGRKVSDQEVKAINIMRDDFHGEWNCTIAPRRK